MQYLDQKIASIAVSGTTSGPIRLESYDIIGLIVPTLDNTTVKLQVSEDDVTYYDLYDGTGTQQLFWSASTGARAFASEDLAGLSGYTYVRVVCGSAQNSAFRQFVFRFKQH